MKPSMHKPNNYEPLAVRLMAAAMAIRDNCKRHGKTCGCCPFHDENRVPHCTLNADPPSEWRLNIGGDNNDE